MTELDPAELDLLARIEAREELRPFFFRKAKGLKWFDAFDERNYFDPANNPSPIPAKEEGYVSIPSWPITEYLVATSPELLAEENRPFAERVLDIIRSVTENARARGFGNYRTWRQFSKIIQNVPLDLISEQDFSCIDYWLDDKYERGLVSSQLGESWLVELLDVNTEESNSIALNLLEILYKVNFIPGSADEVERKKATFRFEKWYAEKITAAIASKSGKVLGQSAVQLFADKLQSVLEIIDIDGWSPIWRAAIEDHEQNRSSDHLEDILVVCLRDSLDAWVQDDSESSVPFVAKLIESPLKVFNRVAIYTIGEHYESLSVLVNNVFTNEYFNVSNQHEIWHLLHRRYPLFTEAVKLQFHDVVSRITEHDDDGNPRPKATAYRQAIWLSSVKHHNNSLESQYLDCVNTAGAEPEHPDFSSYWSSGPVVHESPLKREELLSMGTSELVEYLDSYVDPGRFQGPGIEGLVEVLKASIKSAPLQFAPQLESFAELDSAYVYAFIEAFSELWVEKKELPWEDVWHNLLNFCQSVALSDKFWSQQNSERREQFVANRFWVVGSIGRLIEAGTKTDEHAFAPELLDMAKGVLLILLERQSGENFKPESDAVSIAINSPRGRCLEALINLALRLCRLAHSESDSHLAAWHDIQPIFDSELAKPNEGEYEFITLLVNYLPNFLYMSSEWVTGNLDHIFDRSNYQQWLCAMQAYAYVNRVYREIFDYLKLNGHLVNALDDEHLKDKVSERIIQNIFIAYLNNYECLDDENSLIRKLIDRARYDELNQLVWFVWTLREKGNADIVNKIMLLWPLLLEHVDASKIEGRKLASKLTTWSVFVDKVDDSNRALLLKVASFAEEDYNSYQLIESIARISATQPDEAALIWREIMRESAPDYPEEAIREAFANLVASGDEGRRASLAIADEYIKRGNEKPVIWLREIMDQI